MASRDFGFLSLRPPMIAYQANGLPIPPNTVLITSSNGAAVFSNTVTISTINVSTTNTNNISSNIIDANTINANTINANFIDVNVLSTVSHFTSTISAAAIFTSSLQANDINVISSLNVTSTINLLNTNASTLELYWNTSTLFVGGFPVATDGTVSTVSTVHWDGSDTGSIFNKNIGTGNNRYLVGIGTGTNTLNATLDVNYTGVSTVPSNVFNLSTFNNRFAISNSSDGTNNTMTTEIINNQNNPFSNSIKFIKTQNFQSTVSGNELGFIDFYGTNSSLSTVRGAYIIAKQSGTASTFTPTDLEFVTCTSSSQNINMVITSGGNVGINISSPQFMLDVAGSIHTSAFLSTNTINMNSGQINGINTISSATANNIIIHSGSGVTQFNSASGNKNGQIQVSDTNGTVVLQGAANIAGDYQILAVNNIYLRPGNTIDSVAPNSDNSVYVGMAQSTATLYIQNAVGSPGTAQIFLNDKGTNGINYQLASAGGDFSLSGNNQNMITGNSGQINIHTQLAINSDANISGTLSTTNINMTSTGNKINFSSTISINSYSNDVDNGVINIGTAFNPTIKLGSDGSTKTHIINGNINVNGTAYISSNLLTNNGIVNQNSGIRLIDGFGNASIRPPLVPTNTLSSFTIHGSGTALSTDDGFLQLSAGGGTNTPTISFIQLSGFSGVPDMNQNIVFGTQGTERMRILNNGNVGINTQTPQYTLDVAGKIFASTGFITGSTQYLDGPTILYGNDTNSTMISYSFEDTFDTVKIAPVGGSRSQIKFNVATSGGSVASTQMILSHDGRLGINTTTPQATLDVAGTAYISSNLTTNSGIVNQNSGIRLIKNFGNGSIRPPLVPTNTLSSFTIHGSGTALSTDDGFLQLSAGGGSGTTTISFIQLSGFSSNPDMNQNIVFGTEGAERMRITSTGNVGIGTNNPINSLDVNGTVRIGSQFGNTSSFSINLGTSGVGSFRSAFIGSDGINMDISNQQNGKLSLATNNSDKITILPSGNVGIGTITPQDTLDVNGSILLTSSNTTISRFTYQGGDSFIESANTLRFTNIGASSTTMVVLPNPTPRVGINTQSPQATLDVAGNIIASTGFNTGNTQYLAGPTINAIGYNNSTVLTYYYDSSNDRDTLAIAPPGNSPSEIIFKTATSGSNVPTEALRITNSGTLFLPNTLASANISTTNLTTTNSTIFKNFVTVESDLQNGNTGGLRIIPANAGNVSGVTISNSSGTSQWSLQNNTDNFVIYNYSNGTPSPNGSSIELTTNQLNINRNTTINNNLSVTGKILNNTLLNSTTITISNTYILSSLINNPVVIGYVRVVILAVGGGGGGGCTQTGEYNCGAGGGGSGQEVYATYYLPVSESIVIVCGQGGPGDTSGSPGGQGGDTSVKSTNIDIYAVGGAGGVEPGGDNQGGAGGNGWYGGGAGRSGINNGGSSSVAYGMRSGGAGGGGGNPGDSPSGLLNNSDITLSGAGGGGGQSSIPGSRGGRGGDNTNNGVGQSGLLGGGGGGNGDNAPIGSISGAGGNGAVQIQIFTL